MKLILEILKEAGVPVPAWLLIVLATILIIVGGQTLWIKVLKPWFKKVFKIQDDIENIHDLKEKVNTIETKQASIDTKIDNLVTSVSDLVNLCNKQSVADKAQNEALKMMLCNELDKRYRRYIELGYVPKDEFDEYVDMYNVYSDPEGLRGNHTGTAKFNYVMDHLQVK